MIEGYCRNDKCINTKPKGVRTQSSRSKSKISSKRKPKMIINDLSDGTLIIMRVTALLRKYKFFDQADEYEERSFKLVNELDKLKDLSKCYVDIVE
jgi:hypothetical protein